MDDAIFQRDGSLWAPTASASGPWSAERMHGGPVFALLTRAIEQAAADPALVATRLTFDLFRSVPLAPMSAQGTVLRQSSRLCLAQASLHIGDEEYARATALLLRPDGAATSVSKEPAAANPSGPEGLVTENLMRQDAARAREVRRGFHTRVETRWVPRSTSEPPAIWFRLPIALFSGETSTPLQRTAALADFANAIASIGARDRLPPGGQLVPFINVDATLYLTRPASGEWLCLRELDTHEADGVSVTEVQLFDASGMFGRVIQGRLAQRARPA